VALIQLLLLLCQSLQRVNLMLFDYSPEAQSRRAKKRWGDLAPRFWGRVSKSEGCWLWQGAISKTSPYGVCRYQGKQTTAHRVAFLLNGGVILDGQEVCQTCDNPRCMRPDHLFAGTHLENIRDCINKGRAARGKALNHPPQDGENNHASKLTAEKVLLIRKLFAEGKGLLELSKMFDTTKANVWCIVRHKSWQNI
jgi:hypothetical protein